VWGAPTIEAATAVFPCPPLPPQHSAAPSAAQLFTARQLNQMAASGAETLEELKPHVENMPWQKWANYGAQIMLVSWSNRRDRGALQALHCILMPRSHGARACASADADACRPLPPAPCTRLQVLTQARAFYAAQQRGEVDEEEEFQLDYQVGAWRGGWGRVG
jgi:hypothetical protein